MLNQNDITILSGLTDKIITGIDTVIKALPHQEPNESLMEVYEKDTSTEKFSANGYRIVAPVKNEKRVAWEWAYIKNTGSNSCRIGINGDGNSGFTLVAGQAITMDYKDLKINEIDYLDVDSTKHTTIQFILLRPKTEKEIGKKS